MTMRAWIAVGALSAAVAVLVGAFGAHGLKSRLSPELLAVWETAARYQLVHSVALVALGAAAPVLRATGATAAAVLFVVGTVLFCGSLYALALTGARGLGAVAPIGGLAFVAGWACLAWAAVRGR